MLQKDYKSTNFLTGLRGIATLLVFLIHSGGAGLRGYGEIGNFIVDFGKFGVQIFFVISGFTIFSQLFAEKYKPLSFLLVRIARISLPYFPLIVAVFLYINFGGTHFNSWANLVNNGQITIGNLIAHLTYLSPFKKEYQNTILGVEWTLGVEVFFYFLFAILVQFRLIKLSIPSFLIYFGFFRFANIFMFLLGRFLHLNSDYLHFLPFQYGYMFLLGGLAFYLRSSLTDGFYNFMNLSKELLSDITVAAIIVSYAILALSTHFTFQQDATVELITVASTFLLITLFNSQGKLSQLLENKLLLFFGTISFSFYLLHILCISLLPKTSIVAVDFLLAFGVTTILSYIWFITYEKYAYGHAKSIILRIFGKTA